MKCVWNCVECWKNAWIALRDISKFWGNYRSTVNHMLEKFKGVGRNMSQKVHFLGCHFDYFPANLWVISEEQGERFHHVIKEMGRRNQGRWNMRMMADYCWMLQQDVLEGLHKWKSANRSFENERLRLHKISVHAQSFHIVFFHYCYLLITQPSNLFFYCVWAEIPSVARDSR
jgi:hypothetical protein